MRWLPAVLCVLLAFPVHAGDDEDGQPVDPVIAALIRQQAEAAEQEDYDAYMDTFHKQSPICEARGRMMRECFRVYDMEYRVEQMRVLEQTDEEAKVWFVQLNRKLKGPEQLKDRRVTGVHVLRKSYGKWKIYDTEIRRIQNVDR